MNHFQHLTRNAQLTPADELGERMKLGRPLRIKFGIDPTGNQLHLGHLVILQKLREWQDAGHIAVAIVGDATARVGDPSGRTKSREPMSEETVNANTEALVAQISQVLHTDERFELHRNSEWLNMPSFQLFELLQQTTLSQLLEREDIRSRHDNNQPVSMLEMMYPLLQGFDSVATKADVELGGRDQLINLMMGRQLQKSHGQPQQTTMMMDLLVGTDGVEKMSKTSGNHIPLNAEGGDMFGKVMSIPDNVMQEWSILLGIPLIEGTPRDQKFALAGGIVGMLHDEDIAAAAAADFVNRFVKRGQPREEDIAQVAIADEDFVPAALETAFGISRGEARRMLKAGSIKIDGERYSDLNHAALPGTLIQIGQKRFARLVQSV